MQGLGLTILLTLFLGAQSSCQVDYAEDPGDVDWPYFVHVDNDGSSLYDYEGIFFSIGDQEQGRPVWKVAAEDKYLYYHGTLGF